MGINQISFLRQRCFSESTYRQAANVHVHGSAHESVEEEHVLVKKQTSIAPKLVNAADRISKCKNQVQSDLY